MAGMLVKTVAYIAANPEVQEGEELDWALGLGSAMLTGALSGFMLASNPVGFAVSAAYGIVESAATGQFLDEDGQLLAGGALGYAVLDAATGLNQATGFLNGGLGLVGDAEINAALSLAEEGIETVIGHPRVLVAAGAGALLAWDAMYDGSEYYE